MAHVEDVAAHILERMGGITAMKLQKLCYYSYGFHLAWEERPLFPERFEAWRFTHLDHEGPWGFTTADTATVCDVLPKLGSFESMTVAEVFHRGDEPGKDPAGDGWAGRPDEDLAACSWGQTPPIRVPCRQHLPCRLVGP